MSEPLQIPDRQLAWLKSMAEKHGLPDEHKAMRVLLEYALQEGDEDEIFGITRCGNC